MLRKTFCVLGTLTLTLIPVISVGASIKKTSNDNLTLIYDNNYFSSYEEILAYYLQKYPNAITNKMVMGDIENAIMDFDYNILNSDLLVDYDPGLISPAYIKSSGQLTNSFSVAQKSYANPILIAKKYQGMSNLFDTPQEAKDDRQNSMVDLYQGFYLMPDLINHNATFKYNPLSESDFEIFKNSWEALLNNSNSIINTNDYQKKISGINSREEMIAFLTNSSWAFLEHNFLTNPVDTNGYLAWPETINENNSFDFSNTSVLSTDEEGKTSDIIGPREEIVHVAGEGRLYIRVYPFINSQSEYEPQYWEILGDPSTDGIWGESGRDTPVSFFEQESHKNEDVKVIVKDKNQIDAILEPDSFLASIQIASRTGEADRDTYFNNFNLNDSISWEKFSKAANDKINRVKNIFGNNIDYQLEISLNNDKIDNYNDAKLVNHHFYDATGFGNNNYHYVDKIDLSYFDYQLKFNFKPDPNNILINLNQKFYDYYEYIVNRKGKFWSLDPYQLFLKWIEAPIIVENETLKSVNINKHEQIVLTALEENIKQNQALLTNLTEVIQISDYLSDTNIDLFQLQYGENNELVFLSYINKKSLINAIWNEINKLNNNSSEILINGFSLEKIIKKIMEFLIYDSSKVDIKTESNDWNSYQQLVQSEDKDLSYAQAFAALASLGDLKEPIVLGPKDMYNGINKKMPSLITLVQVQLYSLYLYLEHNKGSYINDEKSWLNFLSHNKVLKKARFDLNHLVAPLIEVSEDINKYYFNINNVTVGSGEYLLWQEQFFNSGLMTSDINNIGQEGIFLTTQAYNAYRNSIINADPPAVKIMYNLDGQIVLGQNGEKIYDSENIVLANVENQAQVKWDPNYVYYGLPNYQKLVLNQKANIYSLNFLNRYGHWERRDFRDFASIEKYLLEKLIQETILIS